MNNLNGNRKNEFRRKQEEKQRKLALKIKDEAGELREGSLKSEEAIPSLDELCAMGERVEQQTTFSAKEAIRNKMEALFAAGVINLPTYQNFLRMKREQEEEPPAKAS